MKYSFIYLLFFLSLTSCDSNSKEVNQKTEKPVDINQIDFKIIDKYPYLYSYRNDSFYNKIKPLKDYKLDTTQIKLLIPKDINIKNKYTYAIHLIKNDDCIIRTFIISDTSEFARIPFDKICIVIYDLENNITDVLYDYFVPDEYGSYTDIEIISNNQIVLRSSNHEFSPDESYDARKENAYVFHPDVHEKTFNIEKNKLKLVKEDSYPDKYY